MTESSDLEDWSSADRALFVFRKLKETNLKTVGEIVSSVSGSQVGTDPAKLYPFLKRVTDLLEQARHDIELVVNGARANSYTGSFEATAQQLWRLVPGQQREHLHAVLSDTFMAQLVTSAARLAESERFEKRPAAEDLEDLLGRVEEVSTAFREAEVSEDLKAVGIDLLETLRSAIVEYDLRGAKGLRSALDDSIGRLVRLHFGKDDKMDDANAAILKELHAILEEGVNILSKASPKDVEGVPYAKMLSGVSQNLLTA